MPFLAEEKLYPLLVDGRYGYMNEKGKIIIKPQFENAKSFHEGLASVTIREKTGYINTSGEFVIKPEFDWGNDFSEGLAGVKLDGVSGFIDKTGYFVRKGEYYSADDFHDGFAAVATCESLTCWSFINKKGEVLIKTTYAPHSFHEGFLSNPTPDGKWGYVNQKGEFLSPRFDSSGSDFHEGLALVKTKEGYGYIDTSGKTVLKITSADDAGYFSDGLAIVKVGNKYGYINTVGDFVIKPRFQIVSDLKEIPPIKSFDSDSDIFNFREGLALIAEDGIPKFINKKGDVVITLPKEKFSYIHTQSFYDGLASVYTAEGLYRYIDKTGKIIQISN